MNESDSSTISRRVGPSPFTDGATVGVGSLPHRDPASAAAFSIGEFDIATVPTMPKRSIVETMISQAVAGIAGVGIDPSGAAVIEATPTGEIVTDLDHEAFTGVRSFLDLARTVQLDGSPVKWQFVGPVTLGVALARAGLTAPAAFDLASAAVRSHVSSLSGIIADALPNSPQMMVLDEPWFAELMTPGFAVPPDQAIDLMSNAMAAVPATTLTGVHCCAPCDVATLLASGPSVISLPVSSELVDWVGYLARYLVDGGIIAWGAVPTDGPVPASPERAWRTLSDLWCALVQRGCDAVLLRRQSLVTPQCGLAWHSESTARHIARLNTDVGTRVKDQSAATRFALGA